MPSPETYPQRPGRYREHAVPAPDAHPQIPWVLEPRLTTTDTAQHRHLWALEAKALRCFWCHRRYTAVLRSLRQEVSA